MNKTKILFDTDIGSDIDDAVCLAYLLCNPMCELVGITTVSGMPVERAMLADALCRAAGKSVPIHPGAENPLLIGAKQPKAQQAEKLVNHPHATDFEPNSAVTFLRDKIYEQPGELTLLAVGPMTNLGLLLATYPETAKMLGGLVLMSGDFLRGGAAKEWNVICDPHAAAIVYAAPAAPHRSVGLNVTTQVTMTSDEVRARFTHPVLKVVADYADVWFRERGRLTFHDPLAAVGIFTDDVLTFTGGTVDVDLTDADTPGRTTFTEGKTASQTGDTKAAPHFVASGVAPERFFERYFSVFA